PRITGSVWLVTSITILLLSPPWRVMDPPDTAVAVVGRRVAAVPLRTCLSPLLPDGCTGCRVQLPARWWNDHLPGRPAAAHRPRLAGPRRAQPAGTAGRGARWPRARRRRR